MNTISLKGMQFFAHHGYYKEEQIMGAYFMLDVEVEVDFTKAGNNDNLADTINYENIYEIAKEVMHKPAKLLEFLVQRIEAQLISYYPSIRGIKIVLEKRNPPLGGPVHASQVAIERKYSKSCSRCKRVFLCHNNSACWCHTYVVSQAVSSTLKQDYKGCLCEECLSDYSK